MAKGCIISLRLVLVVKCVLICLVLDLYTAFERTHLVLKDSNQAKSSGPGSPALGFTHGVSWRLSIITRHTHLRTAGCVPALGVCCPFHRCVLRPRDRCFWPWTVFLLQLCFSEGPKLGGGSSDLSSTSLVIWLKLLRFPAGSEQLRAEVASFGHVRPGA